MKREHPNKPTHTKIVDVEGKVHNIEIDKIMFEDDDFVTYDTGIGPIQIEKTQNMQVKKAVLNDYYARGQNKKDFRK